MVVVPAETPDTTPPVTVARAVLLLLHTPPLVALVNVIVAAGQTFDNPVIIPANGSGFITIVFEEEALPHKLVTVYIMVSIPAIRPVTTPPETVALLLDALHTPPELLFVRVILALTQMLEAPDMLPASGNGFTSTVLVALALPQALLTR